MHLLVNELNMELYYLKLQASNLHIPTVCIIVCHIQRDGDGDGDGDGDCQCVMRE